MLLLALKFETKNCYISIQCLKIESKNDVSCILTTGDDRFLVIRSSYEMFS